METLAKHGVTNEVQAVSESELQAISGGLILSPDISAMPDRTVACGTMWYQQLLQRILGLPR
jgi:hypothetical protein